MSDRILIAVVKPLYWMLTRSLRRDLRRDPEFRAQVINDLSQYGQFGRDCG